MGIINHIGGVTTTWAHINLQCYEVALVAKTAMSATQLEELEMNETATHVEGLDCLTAPEAEVLIDMLLNVVCAVQVVVDNIRDRGRTHAHALEQGFALGIDDSIVGADVTCNEFFDDILVDVRSIIEELAQSPLALDLVCTARTYTYIGLGKEGIACLVGKLENIVQRIIGLHLTSSTNTTCGIVLLHL